MEKGGSRIDLRRKEGTISDLVNELKTEVTKLPMHDFVQHWQLDQYSKLCNSVPEGWAVATLDFCGKLIVRKTGSAPKFILWIHASDNAPLRHLL
ncbi:hypothetical protein PoB_003236600 [Plakobranchus ocellatus]|uniref:Uncharacterized protein n=1 Tax=Plakobranchus ocellatus TaxID=259542 RepID=A0AAV4A3M4_9GAST|nr:hypothetical protein PoB_003236600 [Plakobranchus ocellatus]